MNCHHFIMSTSQKLLNLSKKKSSSYFDKVFRRTFHRPSKSRVTYRDVPEQIKRPPYILNRADVCVLFPEIKTKQEIDEMRPACTLAAKVLNHVGGVIKVGMSTDDIDAIVHQQTIDAGAYPSPLGYNGFPKSVCTSVNKVACHGIPGPLMLADGDIINVDITVYLNGYHGDTSAMFCIGNIDEKAELLVQAAKDCRDTGISICKDGASFSLIGEVIAEKAQDYGLNVIPEFCGHGIGKYFHGPPNIRHVPCSSFDGEEGEMKTGMTFTIEPIVCEGHPFIRILDDDWTAVAFGRSAQWEHTILITQDGCEILTK